METQSERQIQCPRLSPQLCLVLIPVKWPPIPGLISLGLNRESYGEQSPRDLVSSSNSAIAELITADESCP